VISWAQIVPIGKDKKAFVQLGTRIASLRKEQGITQVQMAEIIEVSPLPSSPSGTAEVGC
jgi:hypothetical protein